MFTSRADQVGGPEKLFGPTSAHEKDAAEEAGIKQVG